MGISTKPVQRWEVLQVAGITIRLEGKGILVEMTVDGAARLVQNLRRMKSGKADTYLGACPIFLGKMASAGVANKGVTG